MKKMIYPLLTNAILFFLAILFTGCTTRIIPTDPNRTDEVGETQVLRVMTHDSFAISEEVLAAFESTHKIEVKFLSAGDTGTALNKTILTKGNPLADVFYGVDNTFLSRALEEGIFESYTPVGYSQIAETFKLDPQNRAIPVDYGDVCLNYDIAYFEERQLIPPQSLEDLLKPAYKNLLVVENPATSSPGLAFLLATIGHFGEQEYLSFWKQLVENDVLVVNDWETAYYTEFSRWGGSRPLVVSYSSSPVFEVLYAEEVMQAPPTAAITAKGTCFRQIEFVGILTNTPNRELAKKWVDFMLSQPYQEDIPLQMYVFPVNPQAQLDEIFDKFLISPTEPVFVSHERIAASREQWIQAWTEIVLR